MARKKKTVKKKTKKKVTFGARLETNVGEEIVLIKETITKLFVGVLKEKTTFNKEECTVLLRHIQRLEKQ